MTSGARKGELMKLRWCDVSFKDNTGYLSDTKNGTSRELHFAPIEMTELKRFQEVGYSAKTFRKRKASTIIWMARAT